MAILTLTRDMRLIHQGHLILPRMITGFKTDENVIGENAEILIQEKSLL